MKAHVDESSWSQKEMILFHLLGMNNAEVPPDVTISKVCSLQLLVFLFGKVGHGSFELRDHGACGHRACGEDAQF